MYSKLKDVKSNEKEVLGELIDQSIGGSLLELLSFQHHDVAFTHYSFQCDTNDRWNPVQTK